jgi:hypothetical protein
MMLDNFTEKTSDRHNTLETQATSAEIFSPASDPGDLSDRKNPQYTISRESLVSWLFLIGSLIFTLDAVLENLKGISFSSLLHISASILFTIGSILFLPNEQPK